MRVLYSFMSKKVLARKTEDWEEAIKRHVPVELQPKIASTIFWDVMGIKGTKITKSKWFTEQMDKYDFSNPVFKGEEIAKLLRKCGYSKEYAERRGEDINKLNYRLSQRKPDMKRYAYGDRA